MKTTLRLAAAVAAVTIGTLALPATASAHHPLLTGTTPCWTGETWSVTWTARADADRPLTWRITAPSGYTPSGSQADELPFTRTASYPVSQASATETVSAVWSNQVTGTRSATVQRPEPCPAPSTTTTTTTLPPATTTTEPPATTVPPTDDTTEPTDPPTTTEPPATLPPVTEPTTPPPAPTTNPTPPAPTPPPALPATGPVEIPRQIAAVGLFLAIGAILVVATRRPIP